MGEPTYNIEKIGPSEAAALLEMNLKNRNIVDRAVAEYAAAMTAGQWKFDGAPIRLDDDGLVLDGQHRLSAVVKSGTTQEFLVIYGIDKSAQMVMDTGRKRTFGNILTLDGYKDANQLAAVTALAFRWAKGVRGTRLFRSGGVMTEKDAAIFMPQTPTLLAYLKQNTALEEAVKIGKSVSNQVPVPPRIASFAYFIMSQIDKEDADDFMNKLKTGAGLEDEHPVLVLRNRLQEIGRLRRVNGSDITPETLLAFFIKAWNGYRSGSTFKRLKFTQGGANPDTFPEFK